MPYPFKGLTKAQKRILDELGIGNYSLERVFPHPKSIQKLIDMGLIKQCGSKVYGRTWPVVTILEYEMTEPAHYAWCQWQAQQHDGREDAL